MPRSRFSVKGPDPALCQRGLLRAGDGLPRSPGRRAARGNRPLASDAPRLRCQAPGLRVLPGRPGTHCPTASAHGAVPRQEGCKRRAGMPCDYRPNAAPKTP